jgi:hypothetical protein
MALSELEADAEWQDEHLSLISVPIALEGRPTGALSVYFGPDASLAFATRGTTMGRPPSATRPATPNP